MKCQTCPKSGGSCLGERLPHLCGRPDYRDYLAAYDDSVTAANNLPTAMGSRRSRPFVPSSDGRVRVVVLGPCLQMGGAEAWQLALARSCDPARIEFLECCVTGGEDRSNPMMLAETRKLMPASFGLGAAREAAERADVLVMWAIGGAADLLRGMEDPPRVVEVCHAPKESPWGIDIYGRSSGIDEWVAVSELAVEAIPRAARDAARVSVIRNAVDPARLEPGRDRAEMRRSWGIPPGARVAGYLGRLAEEKDPQAMRRLIDHLPDDWHCVLVGAGCEQIEPHDRLHPVGPDPAAGDVLRAVDVLVVPSKYESFGLTIAEGLWLGVPIVSTRVGIAQLEDDLTYPVPVEADGLALATAVLEADRLGPRTGSREWARANLGPERFGREWSDLICNLAPVRPADQVGYPTRRKQLANFGRALRDLVVDGGRIAPRSVRKERRAACESCHHHDAAVDACKLCGCGSVIPGGLVAKLAIASSSCPDNPPRFVAC